MAVIVPSRGRPSNIARLYQALKDTEAQVDLYVGIDADDPCVDEYKALAKEDLHIVISEQRERFGPTLNRISKLIYSKYDYLAWMGDDHFPRTYGWAQRYRQELDRLKIGIVYGNDLVQGINIPTQMGFSPKIVEILGYAVPDGFIHLFIDNYFLELGKAIDGVSYLEDVIVEHLHPCVGNAEQDLTYREANSQENWTNDQRRFHDYMSEELESDAYKIITFKAKL